MELVQLILLICVFLSIWIKGYATKKGENLATKEDIQDITEKIESVKHSFELERESNRALLTRDVQYDNFIFTERTKRLLDFYDAVILYRYDCIGFNPWNRTSQDLRKTFAELSEKTILCYNNLSKLHNISQVFLNSNLELFNSSIKLHNSLTSLHKIHINEYVFVKIAFLAENESHMNQRDNKELEQAIKFSESVYSEYYEKIEPFLKDFDSKFDLYSRELLKIFDTKIKTSGIVNNSPFSSR